MKRKEVDVKEESLNKSDFTGHVIMVKKSDLSDLSSFYFQREEER